MIVSLTPHDSPPRVDIEITDLPAGTATLQIYRVVDGRTWKVRLAGAILAGSTAYTEDPEAPTGVTLFYRVTALSAAGAILAELQPSTGPIVDAPHSMAWLSDPLDATSARLVTFYAPSLDGRPLPINAVDSWPIGSDLAHTAHDTRVQGSLFFRIDPESQADHVAIGQVLNGPVLIRPPAHYLIGPQVYGIARDLTPYVDLHLTPWSSRWEFNIVPSRGPGASVLVPRRTLGDVEDEGVTLGDLEDQYLTLGEMEVGH